MDSFMILGISTYSYYLAKFLDEKNFEVIAIDSDEARVESVKPFVRKGVIGDVKDKDFLKKVGIEDVDAVIVSLGEKMDDSLLVIYHLKELEIENVYVKVVNEDHAKIIDLIGAAEIIFPERDSALQLAQKIDSPDILDFVALGDNYGALDFTAPEDLVGKTVSDLKLEKTYNVHLISIERAGSDKVDLSPQGNYKIKEGDVLVVAGLNEDLEKLKN